MLYLVTEYAKNGEIFGECPADPLQVSALHAARPAFHAATKRQPWLNTPNPTAGSLTTCDPRWEVTALGLLARPPSCLYDLSPLWFRVSATAETDRRRTGSYEHHEVALHQPSGLWLWPG